MRFETRSAIQEQVFDETKHWDKHLPQSISGQTAVGENGLAGDDAPQVSEVPRLEGRVWAPNV
jgi:hypothetical protein